MDYDLLVVGLVVGFALPFVVAGLGIAAMKVYFELEWWFEQRGWGIVWGGQIGEEYRHRSSSRVVRRLLGNRLWIGRYEDTSGGLIKFVGFGWPRFGMRIAHNLSKAVDQPEGAGRG